MLHLFFAIASISVILVASEVLWRLNILGGEYGRKLVHMAAGVCISTWSFLLTPQQIVSLSIIAFFGLFLSKKITLFHAIHDVQRHTVGELLYPLSVGAIAIISPEPWIFTTAILFVAIADGIAAIVGKKWGHNFSDYRAVNSSKTVVGSLAFFVGCYIALYIGALAGGADVLLSMPVVALFGLPILATLLEAASPYGLDNVFVPLLVAVMLSILQNF